MEGRGPRREEIQRDDRLNDRVGGRSNDRWLGEGHVRQQFAVCRLIPGGRCVADLAKAGSNFKEMNSRRHIGDVHAGIWARLSDSGLHEGREKKDE